MMMFSLVAALLAVPVSASLADVRVKGDHPAVKIISLLQTLSAQIKEEGEAEAVEYAKFSQWCTDLTTAKDKAIATHNKEISVAEASIESLTEDIASLTSQIAELADEITKDDSAKTAGITMRGTDNTAYVSTKQDIESTIQALTDAVTALEAASPPAGLAQVAVKKALALVKIYMPDSAPMMKKTVHAFLQARNGQEPPAETYVSKTGGVIETLKTLQSKFEDDLKECNSAETNSANSHSLADAAKQDEIDAATTAKDTKTEVKGRKGQDLATAETDLSEATEARNSAAVVLKDTKATCTMRAGQWEERSGRREGEIKAMTTAIEVLEKVTGVRAPADKGVEVAYSFVQIKKSEDPTTKIVNLLRKAAGKSKAKQALAKLADKINALVVAGQTPGAGIFDSIKNMIQKMVFHLMSEQKDEDDHKNWCDMELEKTTMMKNDKEAKRDQLTTDIDALTAEIATLAEGITTNTNDVSTLDAQIEEQTADRQEAKTENTATIKDAQDAQNAVTQAIGVLEDFYKNTGGLPKEAWELVQTKTTQDPEEPVPFGDDAYTGTSGGSDVVGMLSDIASDFASMEAEAKSDETSQQDEYDTWLTAAQIDKSEKEKDSEMKAARKERQASKLMGKQSDMDHNTKELDATDTYLANLQPACVEGDSTYEDRKGARTQEIDALKEAQGILENAFAEADAAE